MRYVAIHLPQFHPIPENDEWWGKGFTEWTNVARAKPLFRGHYQPQLPSDLGFYDLRLPEAREAQAHLARDFGIDGFCYYHYWFHGRRILERPFDEILSTDRPDFPFCMFWANETWEGRWHGVTKERRTLIRQDYSQEDDLAHIRWLAAAFSDRRYIKVGPRPVFLVYRPSDLPDVRRTIEVWRNEATRLGVPEPFFIGSNSHCSDQDLRKVGFDGTLQFVPQLGVLDVFEPRTLRNRTSRLFRNVSHGVFSEKLNVYEYESAVRRMLKDEKWPLFRSIIPAWDNSARAGSRGVILHDSTPEKFASLLRVVSRKTVEEHRSDERLVFLNAWNEWAEGNHLEPDQRFGKQYLESVASVKAQFTDLR